MYIGFTLGSEPFVDGVKHIDDGKLVNFFFSGSYLCTLFCRRKAYQLPTLWQYIWLHMIKQILFFNYHLEFIAINCGNSTKILLIELLVAMNKTLYILLNQYISPIFRKRRKEINSSLDNRAFLTKKGKYDGFRHMHLVRLQIQTETLQ